MKQSQNPSQDAYPSSDQSDPPSAFPINHKNPYYQPGQAFIPPIEYGMSHYQSSAHASSRNSLLTEADARLNIDKDLSSGWYALFKYWLYFVVIYRLLALPLGFVQLVLSLRDLSLSPIITIIQSALEVVCAIMMLNVMKHKNLQKAVLAFWLSIINLGFLSLGSWSQIPQIQKIVKKLYSEEDLEVSEIEIFVYFTIAGLLSVIGAWRIKRQIEKREAILKKNSDIYDL